MGSLSGKRTRCSVQTRLRTAFRYPFQVGTISKPRAKGYTQHNSIFMAVYSNLILGFDYKKEGGLQSQGRWSLRSRAAIVRDEISI